MFAGGEAEEIRSVRVCVMARRLSSESVWIDDSCLLVGNELFDKPYKKVNNGGREKGRGEEKGGEGRGNYLAYNFEEICAIYIAVIVHVKL